MEQFKVNGRKVMALIGTPCRLDYSIDAELNAWSVNQVLDGVSMGWKFVPSRAAEDGRNEIIKWYLDNCPQATHILFMDSDTVPDGNMVLQKMFRHSAAIVAGITPVYYRNNSNMTRLSGQFRWNVLIDDVANPPIGRPLAISELPTRPFYASCVGGTTILIRKDVLEKIGPPWFFTERDMASGDIVLGEDFYFCMKARKAGYKILVDPSIQCHHRQYLDLLELVEAVKTAASDPDYFKKAEMIEERLQMIGAMAADEVAA